MTASDCVHRLLHLLGLHFPLSFGVPDPPSVTSTLHPDFAAKKAMKIAADADIYTNDQFMTELIGDGGKDAAATSGS